MAQAELRFTFEPACNATDDATEHIDFDVVEFQLTESLNSPFVLEIDLLSHDAGIDFGKVLDQGALLTIWQGYTPIRRVHGLVSHFAQRDTGFRRTRYHAVAIDGNPVSNDFCVACWMESAKERNPLMNI